MKCECCDVEGASMVCGSCGRAAYCCKEHQRNHWPTHKTNCFPCRLQRNNTLGRFLATSRPVAAGTLLLREWPLVVGPRSASRPVCLGCHCTLTDSASCTSCTSCTAPVCDAECERLAAHSQWECKPLALSRAGAVLRGRPELVLPLRCLVGVRGGGPDWTAFLELEAHLQLRRGTPVWHQRQRDVVEVLRAAGLTAEDGREDELVQRVCGILDVNSFEVRGPAGGEPLRAVFLRAALLAHSCQPSCQLAVDDHLQLSVRASCDLPRGAAIYYNYCDLLETTARRQEHLLEGKYFECGCPRCLDPTESGTFLSSLWCPRCLAGPLLPPAGAGAALVDGVVLPERRLRALPPGLSALPASCRACRAPRRGDRGASPAASSWRCAACGAAVAGRAARSALLRCCEEWQRCSSSSSSSPSSCSALEQLLARLARTLLPRHATLLALKQVLAALYRDQALATSRPATQRHALARVEQLCLEVLEVLEALQPGHLSRLKGIAFHELHVAAVLGAGAGGGGRLERARGLLALSLHHLQHEPRDSPEGQLYQLALQEQVAAEDRDNRRKKKGAVRK